MDIRHIYNTLESKFDRVCTDTRLIKAGDLFFALKGPNYNGNEFVQKALDLGAANVICEDYYTTDLRVIVVNNTLGTLQELARIHRSEMTAKIIAITGSNGKTTTKELILKVFETTYNVIATIGNFNNHIGVPLTLLKLKKHHDFLILEMGANHGGEIDFLCKLSSPDFGLITSIGKAHLEGFGSIEGILKAKMELFQYLDLHNGVSFYNLNDSHIASKFNLNSKHISFGNFQKELNYRYRPLHFIPKISLVQIKENIETNFSAAIFGDHNYQNVIAAISIAQYFNINSKQINHALNEYIPTNMRSQILSWKGNEIILDAYNANPSSMEAAIATLNDWPGEQKWIILGAMAELGNDSELEHRKIVEKLITKSFQKILLIGFPHNSFTLTSNMLHFSNIDECRLWISEHVPQGTTILVKGSRTAKLETLLT